MFNNNVQTLSFKFYKVFMLENLILIKFATFCSISHHFLLCIFHSSLRTNGKVCRMVNVLSILMCMRCSHFIAVLSRLFFPESIGLDIYLVKNIVEWLKEHYGISKKEKEKQTIVFELFQLDPSSRKLLYSFVQF